MIPSAREQDDRARELLAIGRERLLSLSDAELLRTLSPAIYDMLETMREKRPAMPGHWEVPVAVCWVIGHAICRERGIEPRQQRRRSAGTWAEELLTAYADGIEAELSDAHFSAIRAVASGERIASLDEPDVGEPIADGMLLYLADPAAGQRWLRFCAVQYFDYFHGAPATATSN